jgi:hypothetical protein
VADAGGPYSGTVGQSITFNGAASYDPDKGDEIVLYEWDLDYDGKYEIQGIKVDRTFYSPGTGKVRLRIWDSLQAYDTDTATYTVKSNQAPVADAGGPYQGTVGEVITLDGSGSYDPDGQIMGYHWDLDNDGQYDDAFGVKVEKTWNSVFSGTVGLRVLDASQAFDTDSASVTILAENKSPVANAGGPYHGVVGQAVSLDGSGSYDPDGQIVQWQWDLDNDAKPDRSGETLEHTWLEPFTGLIRLWVTDDNHTTVMTTAEVTIIPLFHYDYGDAPDPNFPTLFASSGARHRVQSNSPCLGITVDTDSNGQPDPGALGDDFDEDGDDEDGIVFKSLIKPGTDVRIDLTITNRGSDQAYPVVACWLDANSNGQWDLPDELLDSWLLTAAPGQTTWNLGLTIPEDAHIGSTYVRFRLYLRDTPEDSVALTPSGDGGVGEVEDYHIVIMDPHDEFDFGDAPQAPYPTRLPDAAWHRIVPGLSLGDEIDGEENGVPDVTASGDGSDEDGVSFPEPLVPGTSAPAFVRVMNYASSDQRITVSGWIDFDGNGKWDMDEHLEGLSSRILEPFEGAISMGPVEIPLDAKPGRTYARYRLYASEPNTPVVMFLSPQWFGGTGEVEDYAVEIGDHISTWVYFDPDPNTHGAWEFGNPTGCGGSMAGNPDPNSGFTGGNVYGVNIDGDYATDIGGPYYLELGPFNCSDYARVALRYYRWLNSGPEVRNTIEVRNVDTSWATIWVSPNTPITDSDWQYCEYDITDWAACQGSVYVRWGYEVLAPTTPYSGWNLDDIVLLGAPNGLVPFEDVFLKAAVLNALVDLGISDFSTPPTACQMLHLTELNLDGLDIRDLTGLEFARNLEVLNAEYNHIADLEPISQLTTLRELRLQHNEIRDIRPLANLVNLWVLNLSYNEIEDITPLGRLSALTHLYLAYNQIARVDTLDWSGLTSGFTVLDLAGNLLTDISGLSTVQHLHWWLILNDNEIEDISVLASFPEVDKLTLSNNQIVDIVPLRDLSGLSYLNLRNNDLSPSSCAILDELRVSNPGIEIIEPAACGL